MKEPTGMKRQDFNDAFKALKEELIKKEFKLKQDTKVKIWIDSSQISYDDNVCKVVKIPFIYKKVKSSYEFYRNARIILRSSKEGKLYWSPILGITKRFKMFTSALTDKNQKIRDLANYARKNKVTIEFDIPGTTNHFISKSDLKKRLVSEFFEISYKDPWLPDFIFRHKIYRWLKIRKEIHIKRITIKEGREIVREIEDKYHHKLNPNLPLNLCNFEYEINSKYTRNDWITTPKYHRMTITLINKEATFYNEPEHLINLDRFVDHIRNIMLKMPRLMLGMVFIKDPLPEWKLVFGDTNSLIFHFEKTIDSLDEITPQKIEKIIQERMPNISK